MTRNDSGGDPGPVLGVACGAVGDSEAAAAARFPLLILNLALYDIIYDII
jgi:hypothetical protein